jgi:peptidoglycan-associated lipoprotein
MAANESLADLPLGRDRASDAKGRRPLVSHETGPILAWRGSWRGVARIVLEACRMERKMAVLRAVLVAGAAVFGACHTTEPRSPDVGLTSPQRAPQLPDLGRGAPRIEEEGAYHVFVADPLLRTCSGSVPFFDFDSSATRAADQPSMKMLADCMTIGPLKGKRIKLIGHTDPRGTPAYNEKLGFDRAQRVKEYLVAHGIDDSRIDVESGGASEASAQPEGWPKDRRVEITVSR